MNLDPDINLPINLPLHVALEAQVAIALLEHFRIDRAVNRVTGSATFAHGLMLKDEGVALG